jgi:hypothetical protein
MQAQSERDERGIVAKASPHSSVSKRRCARGVFVFVLIDHSSAAPHLTWLVAPHVQVAPGVDG